MEDEQESTHGTIGGERIKLPSSDERERRARNFIEKHRRLTQTVAPGEVLVAESASKESLAMILEQVLLEAHSLDLIIDEYEVTGNRGERKRLLERGLQTSIRGMEVLINEPFVQDPRRYVHDMEERFSSNSAAVAEELRHDAAALRVFLSAEVRLLSDLGLRPHTVTRTRSAIAEAITEGQRNPETLAGRMAALVNELREELNRLEGDARHRSIWHRLSGVLMVLCGAIVIGGDTLVGGAGAPATGGLSAAGAALSIAAGTEVISQGVDQAREA